MKGEVISLNQEIIKIKEVKLEIDITAGLEALITIRKKIFEIREEEATKADSGVR